MQTAFAQRLRALRKESGLSQAGLAEILEVSQQSIAGWENSRTEPEYRLLIKIAEFFNVPSDYLLGLSDESSPPGNVYSALPPEAVRQIEAFAEFLRSATQK